MSFIKSMMQKALIINVKKFDKLLILLIVLTKLSSKT